MVIVKRIDPRAAQLSNDYNLGNVLTEYIDRLFWIGLALLAFLPLGLIFLAIALPLLFSSQGDWLYRLEQAGNLFPVLMWGVGFLLLSIVGLAIIVVKLWRGQKRVYLFENGVAYTRRKVETVAHWNEIQEVHRHIFFVKNKVNNVRQVSFATSYTIVTSAGSRYSVLEDPGPAIESAVSDTLWPAALADFTAGKPVTFGPITLNRQGIQLVPTGVVGDHRPALATLPAIAKTLPRVQGTSMLSTSDERILRWEELELCWVDETRSALVISKQGERGQWAIVPLQQVSNAALCLALVEYVQYDEIRQPA